MSVAKIRLLAWGLAMALVVLALLRQDDNPPHSRGRRSRGSDSEPQTAPRLFEEESSATEITNGITPAGPLAETAPEEVASLEVPRKASHVIHEPVRMEPAGQEPTLELNGPSTNSSVLRQNRSPDPLKDAAPEVAPLEPRAAQEMNSDDDSPVEAPAPLPKTPAARADMQPVNALARLHVVRGFSLGDRAAIYAARTEFIQALRTIAQALDAQAGLTPKDPQSCSQAIVRGLHALSEVDDFAPTGSRLDGDLDLTAIIAAHRTSACKQHPPASQLAALQAYFDYARDELQRAAAGNPVASQALVGLGKSYTATSEKNPSPLASAKAIVFHQAALAADPANHLAGNELGVLLARHGQWEPAKQALLQSLRVQRDPAAWQNLAAIHKQLGENDLAQLALQEQQMMKAKSTDLSPTDIDGTPIVQWVDPKAFAGPPEDAEPAAGRTAARSIPKTAKPQPGAKSWLPWK
jgi:tetratricopeptide (TPR) repeat protein